MLSLIKKVNLDSKQSKQLKNRFRKGDNYAKILVAQGYNLSNLPQVVYGFQR